MTAEERAREITLTWFRDGMDRDPNEREMFGLTVLEGRLAAALTAAELEAYQKCAEIAEEYADRAKEDMRESAECPNSYGNGYDSGEYFAATCLAEQYRGLPEETE